MGWMPLTSRPSPRPPRRIPTRAMPNREMLENSQQSKTYQVSRQAWDAVQRKGLLRGREMPVFDFSPPPSGSYADAWRDSNLPWRDQSGERGVRWTRIGDPRGKRTLGSSLIGSNPESRGLALASLIHEWGHSAQPASIHPRWSDVPGSRGAQRRQTETEGGAQAFARLALSGVARDLGIDPRYGQFFARQVYADEQRGFRRLHGRDWRSHALYGQFGLKDPRRPKRP